MSAFAQFVVRLADLAEAEGRELRVQSVRLFTAAATLVVGLFAGLCGAAMVLAAVYWGLARFNVGLALLVTGAITLAGGGWLIWFARKASR